MPEAHYTCPSCGRSVRGRAMRSVTLAGRRLLVCKRCVPKFDDENPTYRERKLEFRDQAVHEQQPPPF